MNNSCYRAISPHGLPALYHDIRKRLCFTHNLPWPRTKLVAKFARSRSRGTRSPPALFIHYRAASFGHCTRYAVCVPLSLDCYGISCFTSTGLIENKNFGNKIMRKLNFVLVFFWSFKVGSKTEELSVYFRLHNFTNWYNIVGLRRNVNRVGTAR